MKKALGETQTLCAGRSNAEPKYFSPLHADPFPGGAGRPKFNQLDIQTQFGEDRSTQFRVIVATDPYTQTTPACPPVANTQTVPITIHCAAKLSA